MYACAGKILRVNLTSRQLTAINTADYQDWVGGHGIGAALFFDLVPDKTIGPFDPRNTLVIMSSLFSGTLVPGACRAEMVGIQAQSYPDEWFTRSNIGGRFANMLKFAGFDGIILEGAADRPTWLNIVEGKVELKDAGHLWGKDTYETQQIIHQEITGQTGDWVATRGGRQTTQKPSVLAIGPAGEHLSRIGSIVTDAGSAFGQGGFGGVWGAKKLKAISVLGTGSVEVADAQGLMETRLWAQKNYGPDCDNPHMHDWLECTTSHFGGHPSRIWAPFDKQRRANGCSGCHINCRPRTSTGLGNESTCLDSMFYQNWDVGKHRRITEVSGRASNLAQQMGINTFELQSILFYIKDLYDKGVLGRGQKIDTDLDFDKLGETEFAEDLLHKIAYRQGIGDDLAEGIPRAAERWGRIEEDLATGALGAMFWGYYAHYEARAEVYWGYASLITARDVNCHDFNVACYWMPMDVRTGKPPLVPAPELARWIGALPPYYDAGMIDFATGNIYSEHMAKTTAWLLHYSAFWKQACGLCDNAFADFVNPYGPGNRGLTPKGEVRFFKAVTGQDLSFEQSMETGRRMLNLDKAIWTLQGRRRDHERFPEYMYSVDATSAAYVPKRPPFYYMPTLENGQWDYRNVLPRHFDRQKVEEWKSIFYEMEGWDRQTGWQTQASLESLRLKKVADELGQAGKLP